MGSATWLEEVYNGILSQVAFKKKKEALTALTLVLLKYWGPADRVCWFIGKPGPSY